MAKSRSIRLYVDVEIMESKEIQLNNEQSHYLVNVMRCKDGDRIHIFNSLCGEWLSSLKIVKKNAFAIPIDLLKQICVEQRNKLVLCFAPTKKYGDFVVEKATEMSVDTIIPILSDRGIVTKVNLVKYQKTIIEAAEQSGAIHLPNVFNMTKISEIGYNIKSQYTGYDYIYVVFHTNDKKSIGYSELSEMVSKYEKFVLIMMIGPEGGFSNKDIDSFENISGNVVFLNIGSSIMRSETACIASLTIGNLLLSKY